MCYSAEVSFLTWGFGMVCAIVLGQPIRSIALPLAITQMQLIEGVRWLEWGDEAWLALLGKLAIYAQPVAGMVELGATQWILPYVAIQGVLELVLGSRDLRFVVSDDGHFQWRWMYDNWEVVTLPYWIALAIVTYFLYPLPIVLAGWGMLAYFASQHWQYKTSGSVWCVWVNLVWVYYLLR